MEETESIDAQIIVRVMKDPEFRRNLVANPKETLKKEYKLDLPAGVAVKVHEESDTVRHIVIPKAQTSGVELSDGDLANVAGGVLIPPAGLPGGGLLPPGGPRGGMIQGGPLNKCCTCGASTAQTLSTLQSCH